MGMTLTAKVMPYKQGMGPFAPEVYRLPFAYAYRWPNPERCAEEALAYALDEMHKHIGEDNIAAVIMEPIQGEGGFIVPAPGFVKGIADFCNANGIVFIADEIQSGMGRAGKWFTIVDEGVTPDIVTSAKSLGGGLPISAITGRADLMDAVHVGGLGGTYGGNPVAAAAALAVLDKIESEHLLEAAVRVGDTIMARFRSMQQRFPEIGDVRGRGAMCAMELVADPATKEPLDVARMGAIATNALREGVVVLSAGTYGNVVRLLPPINIDEALLDRSISRTQRAEEDGEGDAEKQVRRGSAPGLGSEVRIPEDESQAFLHLRPETSFLIRARRGRRRGSSRLRIRSRNVPDARKLKASTSTAYGAVRSSTSTPPTPGPGKLCGGAGDLELDCPRRVSCGRRAREDTTDRRRRRRR